MNTEYSNAFRQRIERMHSGMERLPQYNQYIEAHLRGTTSRFALFTSELVPELQHRCGSLRHKRVLDVGCGTGASTAALAEACPRVEAFDTRAESVEIARARLEEHGRALDVRLHAGASLDAAGVPEGAFDVVLLNGVVEHIPLSIPGLRRQVVKAAFDRVRAGGFLVINDTPNRLWPTDAHSTGLPLLSWLPAGSRLAYGIARALGRHRDTDSYSPGPLGLEEVGAWGATYWELLSYLRGTGARCVNLEAGQDERITYASATSANRQRLERTARPVARLLSAPLTAFAPSLTYLVFRKP